MAHRCAWDLFSRSGPNRVCLMLQTQGIWVCMIGACVDDDTTCMQEILQVVVVALDDV